MSSTNGLGFMLEKALKQYYSGWESGEIALGVDIVTLKRWITGETRPQHKSFKRFLDTAKFPPYLRSQLIQLRDENSSRIEADNLDTSAASTAETQLLMTPADKPVADLLSSYRLLFSTQTKSNPLDLAKAMMQTVDTLLRSNNYFQANYLIDEIEASTVTPLLSPELKNQVSFYLYLARIELFRRQGLTQKVQALIEQVEFDVAQYTDIDDRAKALWYHIRGLFYCWVKGDYSKAIHDFMNAKSIVSRQGDLSSEIGVTQDLALAFWAKGDLIQAEKFMLSVLENARQLYHNFSIMRAVGNLGLIYLSQGKLASAFDHIQQHLELAQILDDKREIARAMGNRGVVRLHLGQYELAIVDLDYDIAQSPVLNEGVLNAYVNLSRCYSRLKNYSKAQALIDTTLDIATSKGYTSVHVIALRAATECTLSNEEALNLLHEALGLAKDKRLLDQAGCLLSLAHFSQHPYEQKHFWQEGSKILEDMGAKAWVEGYNADNPPLIPTL
jgi:tetratricopeptide (TPR) repeat protein